MATKSTKVHDELDEFLKRLSAARDELKEYAELIDNEVTTVEAMRDSFLSGKFDVDNVFKRCHTTYFSSRRGHSTSVDSAMRELKFAAEGIITRVNNHNRKVQLRERSQKLNQRFTVGAAVQLDPKSPDKDDKYSYGACFRRDAESEHEYGYYDKDGRRRYHCRYEHPPDHAVRVDKVKKTYYLPLKQPNYRPVYLGSGSDRKQLKLKPDQVATVMDTKASKTYVKVSFGDPVQYVWIRRTNLIVAQN